MKKTHTKTVHHKDDRAQGSYFSYTLGFTLSIIATLIPYLALQYHLIGGGHFVVLAVAFALLQLFVQLVLFLHLNFKKRSQTNLIVFIYTIILVGTVVVGTLWIMQNLNKNMMDNVYPNGNYSPQNEAY